MTKRIAIIGAAGYAGKYVVQCLSETDALVWAVLRHQNTFLVPSNGHVITKHISEITPEDTADVVINLAYATSAAASVFRKENHAILETIAQLSNKHTHIIHVSTLAVFGFQLEKKQSATRQRPYKDYPYVQSKIEMEHLLLKRFSSQRVDIIRPGNIWGPGSASWTIPVLNALVYNLPLLSATPSFSNVTDVHNLADYIRFLCENETTDSFHHLAELGSVTWHEWIHPLAEWLHSTPCLLSSAPVYFNNPWHEFLAILSVNPVRIVTDATRSRYWQQPARELVRMIPRSLKQLRHQEIKPVIYTTGQVFHWIMEAKTLFTNRTDARWEPPLSFTHSLEHVRIYMAQSGYLLPH